MKRWLAMLGALALMIIGANLIMIAVSTTLPRVGDLSRRAPRETRLMRDRAAEARRQGRAFHPSHRWVSYAEISPLLRRAVLIAEDDAFFSHGGLDWNEIGAAARRNLEKRRIVRGGSTITQQLAKNLYVGEERTLTRKLKEMLLAMRLENALGKRRIFELYLNEIEWGDGIFGIEAAARHYFGVSAASLDARQSALLAAVIINPRRFSPVDPPRRIQNRMKLILGRMVRRGVITQDQYLAALGRAPAHRGLFDWLFGPPPPTPPPPFPEPATPDSSEAPAESTGVPL